LASDGFQDASHIGGHGFGIGRAHRDREHSATLTTAGDDGHNLFAVLIQEGGLGAEQIRTTHVAAAQVGAVATRAADSVDGLPSRDLHRVARWTLLPGYEAPGATSSAAPPSLSGNRLSWRSALG
jgi:hypothetical protein